MTLGYDIPWRQVQELLIAAARATPGIRAEPPPFVWQTQLNDVHVSYELNAYTNDAWLMPYTYAALHANIRDAFDAAGIEIMSPRSRRCGMAPGRPFPATAKRRAPRPHPFGSWWKATANQTLRVRQRSNVPANHNRR